MTRMLITRPDPDAQSSLARLQALDIAGVAAPLMERVMLDVSLPPADGFAALVFTSANAVRTLMDRDVVSDYAHLPVLAVGDRTARDAAAAGFVRVGSAAGNFGDLVNAIGLSGLKGPLFYPTGKHQSADLGKALAPMGVMVATAKVYDMVAIAALPSTVLAALGDGGINAVLVYSRRTAEIFVRLAHSLDRTQRRALGMLCMSEAVAEVLLEAHFNRISLADCPDEEAMMALALSFARAQTEP
ncbi:MAG: uroporphyrinogen-III synthase [Candidatus Devosia symbiotica]|nr:uroporphyrinogen-III synthase [Candidatus Devosia symbiotica]